MSRELKILKAVLLLRRINQYQSKETQIEIARKYSDKTLDIWIDGLKTEEPHNDIEYDIPPEHEQNNYKQYVTSSTCGDYSPGNPWDAPGMSIRDFI